MTAEKYAWFLVFVGRPNSGKSSLIRQLTKANPVVGKKPGSTRKINKYILSTELIIVDVPGWGKIHGRTAKYEKRVKDDIIAFFEERTHRIAACIQVIDAKSFREVSKRLLKKDIIPIDQELYAFVVHQGLAPIVALNKIDKITPFELEETINYLEQLIELREGFRVPQVIIPTSVKDGTNLDVLRDMIHERFEEKELEQLKKYIKY